LFGLEFFDSAESVNEFHLTSKERVAFATDVDFDFLFCSSGGETGAASASDRDLVVGRMKIGFHGGNYNILAGLWLW